MEKLPLRFNTLKRYKIKPNLKPNSTQIYMQYPKDQMLYKILKEQESITKYLRQELLSLDQ